MTNDQPEWKEELEALRDLLTETVSLDESGAPTGIWQQLLESDPAAAPAYGTMAAICRAATNALRYSVMPGPTFPTASFLFVAKYLYVQGYRRGRLDCIQQRPDMPRIDGKGGLHSE